MYANSTRVGIFRDRLALVWLMNLPLAGILGCSVAGDSAGQGGQPLDDNDPPAASTAVAEDLEGRSLDPLSESAGHVVVLTFVRTDCPIANRYAPTLRKMSEKFAPRGVSFYLVYPNPDATAGAIREHLQEYAWNIAALRDPEHALVDLVGATVTPEAAVFNREDKLVYHGRIDNQYVDFNKKRPAATTHELEDAIAAALANEAVPVDVTQAVGCFIADLK